ncbi:hypothetical protein BDW59DRAFT_157448 [Aspergillus cavernicola]|uniref:Uncharacterized protein n=1 Tax=Aspergillus cavernicola TaxID=176166 RepID=A0ABR4IXX1_9EURO
MRLQRKSFQKWSTVPTDDAFELAPLGQRTTTNSRSHAKEVSEWPMHPRKVARYKPGSLVADVVCLIVLVPFYVLIVAAYRANGKFVSDAKWQAISQGLNISATAFPLIFSAVIGRLVKRATAYKLERGGSLLTLELLNGSTTLVNTICTYLSLRSVHLLGLALILLWSISPLGGQSPLHSITERQIISSTSLPLQYLDTSRSSNDTPASNFQGSDSTEPANAVALLLATNLLAPSTIRTSSMDFWDNVKIPCYKHLSGSPDAAGWVAVSNQTLEYSSLIGIPVMGLAQTGNVSFTLKSTYFDLALESFSRAAETLFVLQGSGFSVGYDADYSTTLEAIAESFRVWIMANAGGLLYFTLDQIYVESVINCSVSSLQQACRVTAMRKIPSSPMAFNLSQWEPNLILSILNYFNYTIASSEKGFSLAEAYIRSPEVVTGIDLSQPFNCTIPSCKDQLELRFAQLFNSYFIPTVDPVAILQGSSQYTLPATGNLTFFEPRPVCVVHWAWLIIFTLSITLLAVCALATIILNALTLNPDILGYVSTVTWHSRYMDVPDSASSLDGPERTRLLRDTVVRLGDSHSRDPVAGKLSVGTVNRTALSQLGRLYR